MSRRKREFELFKIGFLTGLERWTKTIGSDHPKTCLHIHEENRRNSGKCVKLQFGPHGTIFLLSDFPYGFIRRDSSPTVRENYHYNSWADFDIGDDDENENEQKRT